jgi:hypothetical protein
VISKDGERSQLVGSAEAFLHAVDGDPTACTLLLEAIDAQVTPIQVLLPSADDDLFIWHALFGPFRSSAMHFRLLCLQLCHNAGPHCWLWLDMAGHPGRPAGAPPLSTVHGI